MAIRKIVRFGDSVLEKECRKVEKFDIKLHQLLDDMQESLWCSLISRPGSIIWPMLV